MVSASISAKMVHAAWLDRRAIPPLCRSSAPIPHRGRLWCTGVPTQLISEHRL